MHKANHLIVTKTLHAHANTK